jgi:ribosomal protein S18 acetylase RimI-like enzyme
MTSASPSRTRPASPRAGASGSRSATTTARRTRRWGRSAPTTTPGSGPSACTPPACARPTPSSSSPSPATEPATPRPLACGIVTLQTGSPTWVSGRYGYLEVLSVHPAARGLGVGRRVLDVAQAELDRLGAGELRLTVMSENLGAQAFYRELGFETFALDLRRPPATTPPAAEPGPSPTAG